MPREIKFRGKRLDNSKWIHGYYCGVGDRSGIWGGDQRGTLAVIDEVNPETVGQYTGLRDKKRWEIYEGDIIQTYFAFGPGDAGYGVSQKPFVVVWDCERTAFRAKKPEAKHLHLLDIVDFFSMQSQLYEVIGNIHDNPELLEVV